MTKKFSNLALIFLLTTFVFPGVVFSQSRISELQQQIEEKNRQIQEIQEEINRYERDLSNIGKEKDTLENAIKTLDVSRQKLGADIRVTEQRITNTSLNIEKLNIDINEAERKINQNDNAIAEAMRKMHEQDSISLIENVLSSENLSDFWNDVNALEQFQVSLQSDLKDLREAKAELSDDKEELEGRKSDLNEFNNELLAKKRILDENKKQKDSLLKETKNRESEYQSLLAEQVSRKDAFLEELFDIESQLQIEIDPNRLPSVGSGVLAWPLDKVFVTQYFGNTPFASKNPQVYKGSGHNGIDFRASLGTRVKSALTGTVEGIGDTDAVSGCYSYGKWILIKHNNGLSTLYAHLSGVNVSPGQSIKTGEVIGYSGNSGFSTGPHLHFGVYASQGVRIEKFSHSINCKNATIPIADLKAYLNPLSYL